MNVYILKVANVDLLDDENRREHLCTALDAGSVYGTLAAAQAAAVASHREDWSEWTADGSDNPPDCPELTWEHGPHSHEWSVFVEMTNWWYQITECEVQS